MNFSANYQKFSAESTIGMSDKLSWEQRGQNKIGNEFKFIPYAVIWLP
jgi:hypothetical protein